MKERTVQRFYEFLVADIKENPKDSGKLGLYIELVLLVYLKSIRDKPASFETPWFEEFEDRLMFS